MIISYNWQIIDNLNISPEQLEQLIHLPKQNQQEAFLSDTLNNTLKHIHLRKPHFAFLLTYLIQQPKFNIPVLQLVPQLSMFQERVKFTIRKEIKNKNYIFLEMMIDNYELYDNLMVLTVKIKYHRQKKLQKLDNMQELIRLAGNRQINMHTATTYATIRKEIMVESPIAIEHQQYNEGYLILKISKTEDHIDSIEILQVEVLNWVAKGNQELKKEIIKKLVDGVFRLKAKQTFALAYKMQCSLCGVQMPISIKYSLSTDDLIFKMIKVLKNQQGKC